MKTGIVRPVQLKKVDVEIRGEITRRRIPPLKRQSETGRQVPAEDVSQKGLDMVFTEVGQVRISLILLRDRVNALPAHDRIPVMGAPECQSKGNRTMAALEFHCDEPLVFIEIDQ